MISSQNIKLYFLHGTERFLINIYLKNLLSLASEKEDIQVYDCTERTLKDCLVDLNALLHNKSLFANIHKTIIIKNMWLLKPDSSKIIRFINSPTKHTIIFVEYQTILTWRTLFSQIKQTYQEKIGSFKTKGDFRLWGQNYLQKHQISCDTNLLYRILELSQSFNNQRLIPAPGIFINLIQKLKLLFPHTILSIDHLNKLDPENVDTTIWQLLEISFSNQKNRQKNILQKLLRQRTDPMFIFNLLLDNLRSLLLLRYLLDKNVSLVNIYQQMNRLNKKKFAIDKAKQILNSNLKLTFIKLRTIYSKMDILDHKIKCGFLDIGTVLELLLIRL